jgi:hypothetical protein
MSLAGGMIAQWRQGKKARLHGGGRGKRMVWPYVAELVVLPRNTGLWMTPMASEADERRVAAAHEVLHRFVVLARTENVAVLTETAERLEVAVMVDRLPAAERRLLQVAAEYLRHAIAQRGGGEEPSILTILSQALADED